MTEFTIITKEEFEQFLQDFKIVEDKIAKEIIYDIPTNNDKLKIRIYSSIDIKTQDSRSIGEDAIRCVLLDSKSNKPLDKGKRTNRMTNWREHLTEKLDKLREESSKVKFCKTCGSAMQEREGKNGSFFGCTRYPICMTTMSMDGKYKEAIAQNENIIVKCPLCSSLMKKRNGIRGEFFGCCKYPNCRGTRKVEDVEIYGKGVEQKRDEFSDEIDKELKNLSDSFPAPANIPIPVEPKYVDIPDDDSNVELVKTEKYPHLKFKFENFNPVQSRVFQYYDQDINLIVAAATSAGKTTIAEMLMADSISKGKKAAFLSPLKAVSQEKYNDWTSEKHSWSKMNVSIVTGDYALTDKRVEELNKANIIIMTTEMMDSRTRRIYTEKNDWLLQIGTVVMDESHMLMMAGRGDKCESAMMRFTKQNPSCRIVFLSATMPNVSELAKWLTLLNGKKTELINSNYRPITLDKHYLTYNDMGRYAETEENKINKAIGIAIEKFNNKEQTLIFVHSKSTGNKIKEKLSILGYDSEFHSADLDLKKRLEVEAKTKSKEIMILISTSTLAWGINI